MASRGSLTGDRSPPPLLIASTSDLRKHHVMRGERETSTFESALAERVEQETGSEASRWLDQSRRRAHAALREAVKPADRIALLRELTKLDGGRFDAPSAGVILNSAESALLDRFGLAAIDGIIRLVEEDLDCLAAGLSSAMNLDPDLRTVFAPGAADAPLLRFSDHKAYRSETQKAVVGALLSSPPSAAMMVSMPTGSGKSLAFQLGPRFWRDRDPGACALVITPTIALADDHERTLRGLSGLENCRALTGAVGSAERRDILNGFRRGEIPVLLMSPEAAFGSARSALLEAASPPEHSFGLPARLTAVFIDEAHIIESWGRSFRPDFQRLPGLIDALRQRNPAIRTVLLSATLNEAARQVLRQAYKGGDWLEIHACAPRYDFDLVVRDFDDPAERQAALLALVDRAPRPAIIYTTRVEAAGSLYDTLREERGYERLALFTGDLDDPHERKRIVKAWADNDLDLVVATSAFGLGVDKSNVRCVIHACLPESPARWYQEIGRASRDGHQGLAATLWTRKLPATDDTDEDDADRLAGGSWLSRPLAEKRWRALREVAAASWQGAERRFSLPLDAVREGLGRFVGQRNRNWNSSLINLLQRAGALRVDTVTETRDGTPVWDVILSDDRLLQDGEAWNAAWDDIYLVRDSERSAAKQDLESFRQLMAGKRSECLLTGVYELIEPDVWDAPGCGRCVDCRRQGRKPPESLKPRGLAQAWPSRTSHSALPAGIVPVTPRDRNFSEGLPALVERLVAAGAEQFVVPGSLAAETARLLADSPVHLGLITLTTSWIKPDHIALDLPTAVLMPANTEVIQHVLRACQTFTNGREHQTLLLVADPSIRIDGRPLSQIASALAAYEEADLEGLVGIASPGVAL